MVASWRAAAGDGSAFRARTGCDLIDSDRDERVVGRWSPLGEHLLAMVERLVLGLAVN